MRMSNELNLKKESIGENELEFQKDKKREKSKQRKQNCKYKQNCHNKRQQAVTSSNKPNVL